MPDVYMKGSPHRLRVTVTGHSLGMHPVEEREPKPETVWYRGDDYEVLVVAAVSVAQEHQHETQTLRERIVQLEQARELSAQASATMREESLAKSEKIRELTEALAHGAPVQQEAPWRRPTVITGTVGEAENATSAKNENV